MRRFSSYGPVDKELHYYVPRQQLIAATLQKLKGDDPQKGGDYITVWAPRQTGKSWIMREVVLHLRDDNQFEVIILPVQHLSHVNDVNRVTQILAQELSEKLGLEPLTINTLEDFPRLFHRTILSKPLILIFDEFDGLDELVIAQLIGCFRNIYHNRQNQVDKPTSAKDYLLHSMALIGVRTVLGSDNIKGSPFNIQRSVHIPNLTRNEVASLFNWYQQESGQLIEPAVLERIWSELQGQPGLTGWMGELLTETYNQSLPNSITLEQFEDVYTAALNLLPNNNVLNIISKAKQEPYKSYILELFQTKTKITFVYDEPIINFLYMNGIIDIEQVSLRENYLKFPCPLIQKRLFNYFARELYHHMDDLYDPFEDLSDTITSFNLNIHQLLMRYERYLQAHHDRVLKNAPRRDDLRVYEAVFHFHLYLYLVNFLRSYAAQVHPEFPTGNGQIDLLIDYAGQVFGLELKSFADKHQYNHALMQAAKYGKSLGVSTIYLVLFIETIDETHRQQFEIDYTLGNVTVHPQFVRTGSME